MTSRSMPPARPSPRRFVFVLNGLLLGGAERQADARRMHLPELSKHRVALNIVLRPKKVPHMTQPYGLGATEWRC